jgi:hypothetical protein
MEKKIKSPLNKGLILSLILIAISVITYITINDLEKQSKFGWITYGIIILGIIWACWTYAADMKNNVTFGNVFAHGFKTTAVLTCIVLIYTILSITVIFPEMKEKGIEMARTQMEANEQLSETQIDQALTMTEKFFIPFAIGGVLIGYLFIGAIASLIGAAVVKKNPNPTPFETDVL